VEKKFMQANGLFVVCAKCKRIKDIEGAWHEISPEALNCLVESMKVSHGICLECAKILYPNLNLKSK